MIKQEGDYWIDHEFPPLLADKDYYYVLFRNGQNNISWEEISLGEFTLLQFFKQGSSIEEACDKLENEEVLSQEIASNLALWFQKWVIRSYLSLRL